jgi:hypothetical protein
MAGKDDQVIEIDDSFPHCFSKKGAHGILQHVSSWLKKVSVIDLRMTARHEARNAECLSV